MLVCLCVCVYARMCVYLYKVMRAEVEEFQQLKVAACRQDILDHRWLQQDLSNSGGQGDRMRGQTRLRSKHVKALKHKYASFPPLSFFIATKVI